MPGQYENVRDNCYRFIARAGVDWLKMEDVLENETVVKNGWEYLEQVKDSGAVLVGAHFGFWEMSAVLIARELGGVTVYADRQSNPYSERLIAEMRKKRGITAVQGATGARTLARLASEGEIVGILGDQRPRNQPVTAPFFGYHVHNTRILPFIARKSGVPVLPGLCYWKGSEIEFKIGRPLPASLQGVTKENRKQLVAEYNQYLEEMVRKYPEQYFWLHNRFKKSKPITPENSP